MQNKSNPSAVYSEISKESTQRKTTRVVFDVTDILWCNSGLAMEKRLTCWTMRLKERLIRNLFFMESISVLNERWWRNLMLGKTQKSRSQTTLFRCALKVINELGGTIEKNTMYEQKTRIIILKIIMGPTQQQLSAYTPCPLLCVLGLTRPIFMKEQETSCSILLCIIK